MSGDKTDGLNHQKCFSPKSSKLEKADILEKTVLFVSLLQQQNARLQQQLHQVLAGTEPGQAFQRGVREGISLSVTATVDVLAGMPPPFNSAQLCQRVRAEVPEKVTVAAAGGLLMASPTGRPTPPLGGQPVHPTVEGK